jgi:hypothetical protein
MWKWIVGGCLGLIVIVCVVMYVSYQKMKSFANEGPVVTQMIAAPTGHVFAALSDVDSLRAWRLDAAVIRATQHGPLHVGDTLSGGTSNQQGQTAWVVSAVVPDTVVAFDGIALKTGKRMFTRRDSVSAVGDSTKVTSIFTAAVLDSLSASGKTGGMMDVANTAVMGGLRLEIQEEMKRLKSHIEGKPATPSAKH